LGNKKENLADCSLSGIKGKIEREGGLSVFFCFLGYYQRLCGEIKRHVDQAW
jgi:hypothetical protein